MQARCQPWVGGAGIGLHVTSIRESWRKHRLSQPNQVRLLRSRFLLGLGYSHIGLDRLIAGRVARVLRSRSASRSTAFSGKSWTNARPQRTCRRNVQRKKKTYFTINFNFRRACRYPSPSTGHLALAAPGQANTRSCARHRALATTQAKRKQDPEDGGNPIVNTTKFPWLSGMVAYGGQRGQRSLG